MKKSSLTLPLPEDKIVKIVSLAKNYLDRDDISADQLKS